MTSTVSLIFFLTACYVSLTSAVSNMATAANHQRELALLHQAMVHDGQGAFNLSTMNDRGTMLNVAKSGNDKDLDPFREVQKNGKDHYLALPGQDAEIYDLIVRYFWGMRNGAAIEIGAVDGIHNSQTKYLADKLGWKRVLIEANPETGTKLKANAPEALSFHTAVCSKTRTVHYAMRGDVSGIAEFMSQSFIRQFHGELVDKPINEWDTVGHLKAIPCLPMSSIIRHSNTTHFNYFLLDTEGAEFDILKTVSWSEVMFDIISVETERDFRPPGYEAKVKAFLSSKGYKMILREGRNTWYQRNDFIPSPAPGMKF